MTEKRWNGTEWAVPVDPNAVTAEPIMVSPNDGGNYVVKWVPQHSGFARADGPIMNWDNTWLEVKIFPWSYAGPFVWDSPESVGYGYWHYDPTDVPTSTDRYTTGHYVTAGEEYRIMIDMGGEESWDISATLASLQHLGYPEGWEHLGRIAPPQFPFLTYEDTSIVANVLPRGGNAEGLYTFAEGRDSHAEGSYSHAQSDNSHAEGWHSHAEGSYSHAEGSNSHAQGGQSHAEGAYSRARWLGSHAGASSRFSMTGDAQYERVVVRGTTGSAPPWDRLWPNHPSYGVHALPENFVAQYRGMVTSRTSNGAIVRAWKIEGVVTTVGTPALLPGATVTTVGEMGDASGWDITVAMNVGTDIAHQRALAITPSGLPVGARTVATLEFTEVG